MKNLRYAILFFFFFSALLFSGSRKYKSGTIYLFEKPQELFLFDKYKMQLNEMKKGNLIPFQPFIISGIDESGLLQKLLIVKSLGKIFFIGLEDNLNILNKSKLGKIKILDGYKEAEDYTITFSKPERFLFYSFPKRKSHYVKISDKSEIKFIAAKKNKYLVILEGEVGLLNLPKKSIQKLIVKKTKKKKLNKKILSEIEGKFKLVNNKFKILYSELNKEMNAKKKPPVFIKENDFKYKFRNGKLKNFTETTNYLLTKINLLLLNSGYEALAKDSLIIIR